MINYLNNILTFILWLDLLQRRFPKIEKFGSNIYILIYSYFEFQLKKNGIDIFNEPQIEKVSIVNDTVDENDFKIYNKEIWDIVNKHRTLEKEKYS
jgi:hypothetical protein